MKKGLFLLMFAMASVVGFSQGGETFDNSNLTGTYSDGSFVGDNSVTWSYIHSRNDGGYSITGEGIMLRRSSSSSKVTSSSVSGGIGSFTCSLKKAFTGSGNRQVELFINGISKGTSITWDNTAVQTFTVNDIDIEGGVIIEIRNIRSYQVIVDDISWTGYVASTNTEVQFTAVSSSEAENGISIDVCASIINEDATNDTTVDIALEGSSTATNGTDYTSITFPYTLTFPATSSANQCLTFTITDDMDVETSEVIDLSLENVTGGNSAAIGDNDTHTLTIMDNDFLPVVGFTTASSSVTEGDAGTSIHTVIVSMDTAPSSDADVDVISAGNTATEGSDYIAVSTTLTFPAIGSYPMTQNVSITINGDHGVETDEIFDLALAMAMGDDGLADEGTDAHEVTITNDDVLSVVGFTSSSSSLSEGDAGVTGHSVAVSMDTTPSADVVVNVITNETVPESATEDTDYTGTLETLTFLASGSYPMTQNVVIPIVGDTNVEGDEDFLVNLSISSGMSDLGTTEHTVTIEEDDLNVGDIVINEYMANPNCEGDGVGEFVELYNTTGNAIDIVGWILEDDDGDSHTFNGSNGTTSIAGSGYLVCGIAVGGTANPDYDYSSFSLANGGDEIVLKNGVTEICRVDYSSSSAGVSAQLPQDYDYSLANDGVIMENEYIEANATFGCGDLGTPGAANILPIQLLSFTAKAKNNQTLLTWKTATELNNDYMAVEHSTDGRNFKEIGRVQGAGTSADVQEYQFTDTKPIEGLNYYRLRQVDYDGHTEYHKVVSVMISGIDGDVRLVPTEVQDEVMLYLPETLNSAADIRIYDVSGRLWKTSRAEVGNSQMSLSLSQLAAGHYILHFVNGERVSTVRFNKL